MSEEIIIKGRTYRMIKDEHGKVTSLKRFNDKYKMFITINFSKEDNDVDDQIIGMLSEEYLKTIHS